jgi:hypothetical protein
MAQQHENDFKVILVDLLKSGRTVKGTSKVYLRVLIAHISIRMNLIKYEGKVNYLTK